MRPDISLEHYLLAGANITLEHILMHLVNQLRRKGLTYYSNPYGQMMKDLDAIRCTFVAIINKPSSEVPSCYYGRQWVPSHLKFESFYPNEWTLSPEKKTLSQSDLSILSRLKDHYLYHLDQCLSMAYSHQDKYLLIRSIRADTVRRLNK